MNVLDDGQAGQARVPSGRDFVPGKPYVRADAGLVTARPPAAGTPAAAAETLRPMEIVRRLLARRYPREMNRQEISEACGLTPKQTGNALCRLRRCGAAEHGPRGGWRIAGRDGGMQSPRETAREIVEGETAKDATDLAKDASEVPREVIERAERPAKKIQQEVCPIHTPSPAAPESLPAEMAAELQKLRVALRGHAVPSLDTKLRALEGLGETLGGEIGQLLIEIRDDLVRLAR